MIYFKYTWNSVSIKISIFVLWEKNPKHYKSKQTHKINKKKKPRYFITVIYFNNPCVNFTIYFDFTT